jgi:hypothetical protein
MVYSATHILSNFYQPIILVGRLGCLLTEHLRQETTQRLHKQTTKNIHAHVSGREQTCYELTAAATFTVAELLTLRIA